MPKLLKTPFAIDAAEGFRTDIQESTGAAPNSATYQVGFPPVTMQSIASNGMPPKGSDLNGVLYDITDNLVFLTQGGGYGFDAAYATSIGGYPLNARLRLTNGDIVKSTIDGNVTDPNFDMTGWVKDNSASQIFDESGKDQQEINDEVQATMDGFAQGASKFYPTLAEANADIANIAVNQVVNIGEVTNGGLWYKETAGATTLTKSPYDPLTQAEADATTKANAAEANAKADATTKANTAKSEAIAAAAADATTKANASEANAKSYADNATEPEILSGTDIYYRSKDNPARLFQAIWQEYNKPVWYIGNSTFVDTTGANLKLYEQELLFTIKLTEANQTFIYPTRPTGTQTINATIDWGDGIVTSHTNYSISHSYTGAIGDEFQIKLKGVMPEIDFGSGNAGRRTSRLMLKSVDKNTMPKVMTVFDLAGCTNLVYLCRGAYSSWNNGSTFSPRYAENSPNIIFHPKAFEGLESVTDISGIFGRAGYSINFDIPAGLLDVFANATIASYAFYGLAKPLPVGILDKLINLEDVSYMFNIASITSIDNRIFKNQTKLKNVSNCFRQASSLVANAHQLYTDMNQGLPTIVNGCFLTASAMTNLASVPAGWKA